VVLSVLSGAAILAQTTSTITGTIRDPTGLVLSGARVSARHIDTNLTRTATTSGDGRFVFPVMPVGLYEIRAESRGFRPTVRRGIELTVRETAVLDLTLEIGDLDQEITVVGHAPLVNTQTSELSYLVTDHAIRELPLNGRNYTDLALLQPGVIAYPHRDGGSVVAHGLGTSVNGQDPRSNVYLLDGTLQNDFTNGPAGSAAGTVLGMETIREFRVEVNAYSAEFGRNSGGQINVLTKSGTNHLHGSLYEFHRNDNLDARDFFDRQKPDFKRNQFGASLGGPVRKDRSFVFGGYEGLREGKGRTVSTIVPDENARRGVLPTGQVTVSNATRPYLDAYPLPNGQRLGDGLAEYFFPFRQGLRQDFGQIRFDHNLGIDSQFFLRYTVDDAAQRLPTDFPQFPRSFLSRNHFLTAEYRHAFSAAALNTFRTGFSRTKVRQEVEANLATPLPAFIPGRNMMGGIDIGGIPGRFGPQTSVDVRLTQNVFSFEDGLILTRGSHILKFGGLAERYQDNMVNPTFALGIYTFRSLSDFLQNIPLRFLGLTPEGALDRYWRFTLFGFYIQDDIRVHSRLTLNLGLRYEFSTMPIDIYGRDSALINLSDPAPTVGRLSQNPTRKNLSPRVGFAWDIFGNGSTALRGGYGWFFNTNNQQNLIVTVTNPPATPRIIIANPTFPVPPFERGVGNSIRPVEWNIKNPNVHIWNLNVQRRLPFDAVVTVGYAGARGIHLLRSADANVPTPQQLSDGTLFFAAGLPRPNRAFSTIEIKKSDGNSWYNAGILEVRKRWSRGFTFQSSYTFSRNIDTTQASTFFSDATNGTTSAMPEFPGFNYNKGLADYHATHNWVVNLLWEIPGAKNMGAVGRVVLDGWQLGSIAQVRSGNPLTVFVRDNRSRSLWNPSLAPGIGFDRPSMAPGFTHQTAINGQPDRWFNPSAFVLQPAGTLGNLGRGALIGPDLRNLDVSAMKNFKWGRLGEATRIEFRVETFNLFNQPNFGPPSLIAFTGAVDNEQPQASLGRVRNTVTSSRQIQLGLRVAF
jgi:hypothetical protein